MSNISGFNLAFSRVNDTRPDIQTIIRHCTRADHTCTILATGNCHTCRAYLAHRNGHYIIINDATIGYNYLEERTRSSNVARLIWQRHTHISRSHLPEPEPLGQDTLPIPSERPVHVCPPCELAHVIDHPPAPCPLPHLGTDNTIIINNSQSVQHGTTESTNSVTQLVAPPIPQEIWSALQLVITSTNKAASTAAHSALRKAIDESSLSSENLISALQPTITTITKTIIVKEISQPEVVNVKEPCTKPHLDNVPKFIPNNFDEGFFNLHTAEKFINSIANNSAAPEHLISLNAIEAILRPLYFQEVNLSAETASLHFLNFLRRSAACHNAIATIRASNNDHVCDFWPCICNWTYHFFRSHNIDKSALVPVRHILIGFLRNYFSTNVTTDTRRRILEQERLHSPFHPATVRLEMPRSAPAAIPSANYPPRQPVTYTFSKFMKYEGPNLVTFETEDEQVTA